MAKHHLRSKAARELPLLKIARMNEGAAYRLFCRARRPETDGNLDFCIRCGSANPPYAIRHRAFKCRNCRREFSVTSGTPFAGHKLSFRDMLVIAAMIRDGLQGKGA